MSDGIENGTLREFFSCNNIMNFIKSTRIQMTHRSIANIKFVILFSKTMCINLSVLYLSVPSVTKSCKVFCLSYNAAVVQFEVAQHFFFDFRTNHSQT